MRSSSSVISLAEMEGSCLIVKIVMVSAILSLFFGLTFPRSYGSTATHKFSYNFYVETGLLWEHWEEHTLYVSVTQSLYEYYQGKDHSRYSDSDYSKFVTPDAVKPIAERIWSICYAEDHNEEQFANAVLMFIHQIPYVVSSAKYSVETIVENSGDCDVFSLLAASIIKAKGMDVVLFDWTGKSHMNIGVYLSETPVYVRQGSAWYISYNSKRYYIAECTGYCSGANATSGWRVGECPDDLKQASATIIPLSNAETGSPAQVSARVDTDLSSSYFATLIRSPQPPYYVGQQIQIQGTISPAHSGENVVLYYRKGTSSWAVWSTTGMDSSGAFSFTVTFSSVGTYYLWASWSGDVDHEGADSSILIFDVSLMPSCIYLTVSSSAICLGEAVNLTGYISPAHSYQSANLYYSQSGEDWFILTVVTTDSNGYFSYQWLPASVGIFYLKATWSGDLDHQGASSEISTTTVSKASSTLTLSLSSSSINLGDTVSLSGEVSPAHGNINVDVYVSGDGTQWSFLISVITDVQGRYAYQWSPTSSGTYYFKACWSGDVDHAGDESNISMLQVIYSPTTPEDQGNPNPPAPDNQNPWVFNSTYVFIALLLSMATIGICLLVILRNRS
jgi:hypothetical protein